MDMSFKFDTDYVAYSYTSIWKRALGRLIDMGLIYIICTFAVQAVFNSYVAIFFVLLDYIYTIACIYGSGQTLGLWIVGGKVVSTRYKKVSLGQVLLRTLCSKLSTVVIGIGNLWILFNDSCQTWHDILAETIVLNKKYAPEVESFMEKKPWDSRRHLSFLRVVALFLSLNIIFYLSMDKLVNAYGKFGLTKTKSFTFKREILDAKSFDIKGTDIENKEGKTTCQLAVLSRAGYKIFLDIYNPSRQMFSDNKSLSIDEEFGEKISLDDFSMDDINNDGIQELFIAKTYMEKELQVRELVVYSLEGTVYKPFEKHRKESKIAESQPTTCTAYTDEKGVHKVLWCDVSEVKVMVSSGKALKEDYTSYFGTINSAVVMADFLGKGRKVPCVVQQYTATIEVNALDISDRMHLESLGKIKDYLGNIEDIQRQKVRVGDINGDDRDEIMLIDEENGLKDRKLLEKKQSAWLNIYAYDEVKNSWYKVWIGGNINLKYKDRFKETMDINGDGKLEAVMINGSKINAYKYKPFFFDLNSIWLKEYKTLDNIMH